MKMHRYKGDYKKADETNRFFIQSHGKNAGRPLKIPIPNSWELITQTANAFEICYMIFESGILKQFLRGSVIPFLSLKDYKKILLQFLQAPTTGDPETTKKLNSLFMIEKAIQNNLLINSKYHEIRKAIANDILKKFKNDKICN